MNVQISTPAALELQACITEAERLTSQSAMTKQEERRYNLLLSKIALLRQGFTPGQIARVEAERIAKDAGLAHIPTPLSDEREKEWRDAIRGEARYVGSPISFEVRAVQAGSEAIIYSAGAKGGFFVPQDYADRNVRAMRQYDELFDDANCNVIETVNGQPTVVPSLDDVTSASTQVDENTLSPSTDFAAGVTQLKSYSFRSGIVYCSIELLQDSGVPIGALLEAAFAVRHARGVGAALTTGTGTNQPQGLVTAAVATDNIFPALGANQNTGESGDTAANSIGSNDLSGLYGLLNKAYRRNAVFYMTDDTLTTLRNLNDRVGRPLVQIEHDFMTVYGKRVAICPSMDEIGPSKYPIVFADPSYFFQRRVTAGSYLQRFVQSSLGITSGSIGFQSWYRTDSRLAVPNPSFPPCAVLQMGS